MQIRSWLSTMSMILVFFCTSLSCGASNHNVVGVGELAQNLMEPISLLSDFVNSACFIIGASFVFASLIKYLEHRKSPLSVPISTVIFLLIAGIILILLPFIASVSGSGVHYFFLKS